MNVFFVEIHICACNVVYVEYDVLLIANVIVPLAFAYNMYCTGSLCVELFLTYWISYLYIYSYIIFNVCRNWDKPLQEYVTALQTAQCETKWVSHAHSLSL